MTSGQYIVSVDGGGTHTEFCIYNSHTHLRHYFTYGSTNHKVVGEEQAEINLIGSLHEIMEKLSIEKNDLIMCVLGLSGLDSEEDKAMYHQQISKALLPETPFYLCNDAELAFYAISQKPGIVVVAGTGSIAYGFSESATVRSGGWGGLVSDLGSGTWIGMQVLRDILLYCDGQGPYHTVYQDILKESGAESFEALPFLVTAYPTNRIASYARIICDHGDSGDPYSTGIVREAAVHVAMLVESVYRKASFKGNAPIDCVRSGGLFKCNTFKEAFKNRVALTSLNLTLKAYSGHPVDGGVQLAQYLLKTTY